MAYFNYKLRKQRVGGFYYCSSEPCSDASFDFRLVLIMKEEKYLMVTAASIS